MIVENPKQTIISERKIQKKKKFKNRFESQLTALDRKMTSLLQCKSFGCQLRFYDRYKMLIVYLAQYDQVNVCCDNESICQTMALLHYSNSVKNYKKVVKSNNYSAQRHLYHLLNYLVLRIETTMGGNSDFTKSRKFVRFDL